MTGFGVGSLRVTPLVDGFGLECARDVLTRAGVGDPWAEHADQVDEGGDLRLAIGGYLLRTGDRVVLIDAGVGTIDNGRYRGGAFLESLRREGLEPEDVTDVVFTHLHFDHVGWATQKGQVVFPRATHHVHEADWERFVAGAEAEPGAVRKLSPLTDRLATFGGDTPIAPGLDARPAVGHTPGSTVYVVSDAGEKAVFIGDLAHSVVELVEPGWSFHFDTDPAAATQARGDLVEEFLDTEVLIAGGHFPDFRPGRLRSAGDTITWTTNEEH
jgi:glyoxylase-like metal-dependent hydrolase (beta-lactamase superfamily II)